MSEMTEIGLLHRVVLLLPAVTTICAVVFCYQLFGRWRLKGGGLHLLWWGLGMATYGIGTFTEAFTSIAGWHPTVFRLWYVAGAFLGGYPLAQGSIYLLMSKRFAHASAWVVSSSIALASVFVFLTPLNLDLVETHRLSGDVIEWSWVRMMSPFINLYSVIFLVGGAFVSALRYRQAARLRNRYVGNILIAIGALLPGIGGTMTRAGYVEALYLTELVGLLLIYAGYRLNISGRQPRESQAATAPPMMRRRMERTMKQLMMIALLTGILGAPYMAVAEEAESEDAAAGEVATQNEEVAPGTEITSFFEETTVTATGSEVDAFEVSTPVTILGVEEIEARMPDNAADLLREEPGVDINGVGPNQARPVIRGQRGLRVLFLENGLRMNNARRQTDFGEIPGLVDMDSVESMEVVRGPASVLYGSDAIGGVLNLITRVPTYRLGSNLGGEIGARYGSAGESVRANASVEGLYERTSFRLGLSTRDADDYQAASGSFGELSLDSGPTVTDTGIEDDSLSAYIGRQLADGHELSLKWNRYRADQTGFGFVEPSLLGESEDFRIRILYPFQDFDRFTLGYVGSGLDSALADTLEVQVYQQNNERRLANDIDIVIGVFGPPGTPPSTVAADTDNFTDLETFGTRIEVVKVANQRHLVTYGLEYFEDDSFNTDFSTTTTTLNFAGAPFPVVDVSTDDIANAPNAENTSYGLFAQGEFDLGDRFKLTVGARYQNVETRAQPTPDWDITGLDFEDDSVVGAVNLLYRVNDNLRIVGGYGTAFRAPNIVERLFNGVTPEGAGYQVLNPDLVSENSENFDIGLKYRRRSAFLELAYFENTIEDGVIQNFLSPAEVARLPQEIQDEIAAARVGFVVQQTNADRLLYEGIELAVGWRSDRGLTIGGNYTHLDGKRLDSTNPPTGDTVTDKINAYLRWQPLDSKYWAEYRVRHNGDERANIDPDEGIPVIGEIIPSFTIHTLAGGVSLYDNGRQSHDLALIIDNVSDELYAEFSNATFFRPEPERNVTVSYRLKY